MPRHRYAPGPGPRQGRPGPMSLEQDMMGSPWPQTCLTARTEASPLPLARLSLQLLLVSGRQLH